MLRKLFLILVLFSFVMPLEAKFLLIPLKKRDIEISNKVFSIINTQETKWQIKGSYPLERDNELIFYFIPENQTENNRTKEYILHGIINSSYPTLEDKKRYLKITSYLDCYCKLNIIEQTDKDFIYELYADDPKRRSYAGYEIGLVEILPNNRSWHYQFYQKNGMLNEPDKQILISQFKQMRKIINNT